MTTRLLSLNSLRELAASTRRGFLAGSSWPATSDRDLDRVAADLLMLSQADRPARGPDRLERPVDLADRRGRAPHSSTTPSVTAPTKRAS